MNLGCSRWPATRPTKDGDTRSAALRAARSRHEILRLFPDDTGFWRIKGHCPAARSPNLNAYAERWILSAKQECLAKLILFGEGSLRRALREFIDHFHTERTSPGKEQRPPVSADVATHRPAQRGGPVPRTPRWFTQILLRCRMNSLTRREEE